MAREKLIGCTREAVAARAGVSSATVSRFFNHPGSVSSEKAERVRRAVAQLGYVPDRNASALRRRGTGEILLIMPLHRHAPDSSARVYDWLYADGLQSVQSVLEPTCYRLQLAPLKPGDSLPKVLAKHPCDGAIVGMGLVTSAVPDILKRLSVPYVCCVQTGRIRQGNLCYIDEYAGGQAAAQALRQHGRAKPAHITGSLRGMPVCQERWMGFRNGFPGQSVILQDGELGIQGGHRSAEALLPSIRAGRIDGIFAVNDLTAVGVVYALQEHGIRIPEDVALVGYDNLPFLHTLPVRLATIDLSVNRLYATAAEKLLQLMRAPGAVREPIVPTFVPGASL